MSNAKTEAQRLADAIDPGNEGSKIVLTIDVAHAAAELRRLDAVEAENKRLKDRLDFHLERSAQREQRLWVWAHEELSEPLKTRYFNIVANGTADVMEQPVYAQQFNIMRHRAESAEAERDQLRAQLDQAVAEEREACAKVCETLRFSELGPTEAAKHQRNLCAAAIRARSNT